MSLMDVRLTHLLDETLTLNERGQLETPWPSCHAFDGFDDVSYLHIQKSAEIYQRIRNSSEEECLGIPFVAETSTEDLTLDQQTKISSGREEWGRSGWGAYYVNEEIPDWYAAWDVYLYHSTLDYTPSFLTSGEQDFATGKVLISGGLNMRHFYIPDDEGQPPHILLRAWTFEGDAADRAREALGAEDIEGEEFTCLDLYYGYFDEE